MRGDERGREAAADALRWRPTVWLAVAGWSALALLDLAPALYGSWVSGRELDGLRLARGAAAYLTWIPLTLLARALWVRFPLPSAERRVWIAHLAFSLALGMLHIAYLTSAFYLFDHPGVDKVSLAFLFTEQILHWLHVELAAYWLLMLAFSLTRPKRERAPPARIALRVDGENRWTEPGAIRRIEAYDNYVNVYVNGERWLVRATMAELDRRLEGCGFLRVHRSAIVNLRAVAARRGDTLVLDDATQVRIGPRYAAAVRKALATVSPFATD